jgi:dUTP pyrophosphatase
MKVKIKRLDRSVDLPKYQTHESAAFDISANEEVTIEPRQIKRVRTGLVIESPQGYFLLIAARSSTPRKKGLTIIQGIGIIDRDFSGPEDEVLLQLYNFSDKSVQITKGERLAQGIFLPVDQIEWNEVDQIREKSRGGFGSTGGMNV